MYPTVFDCSLITLPRVKDRRGNLTPVHNSVEIPFDIKRVFYLYDVPAGESRGAHAHFQCHQFLIAASGSFEVLLDDGHVQRQVQLTRPYIGLHVPPMIWASEMNFSSGAICLVLASESYNAQDYIRDYEAFLIQKKITVKFNNRNVHVSTKARIGNNVKIGDNTTIYDNVVIKDNSIISNDCIIGEPLTTYYEDIESYQNPETILEEGALLRSHNIIYAGCHFGKDFSTGHRVTIREGSSFGEGCRIGTLCDIQGHVTFGDHCWLHSNVHIGQNSTIGNFVFIYPYVVFTNDPHPPSNICIGPTVEDYTQIGVFSVLLPGVQIGKHCLLGAGCIVGKNIEDYQLVIGNPGKPIKDVRQLISKETGKSHYPWPYNFDRGMPWEDMNFDEWLANKNM